MEHQIDLEGGGRLEVREEGAKVHLSVVRGLDGAGLYKAWLRGDQGELLLGTLIPEGPQLRLERTMSQDALRAAGCWPVTGGRTGLVFSFSQEEKEPALSDWRWEHRPGRLFLDPLLSETAAAWGPMLFRKDGDGFQLAAPLDPLRPFPMTALFCFGWTVTIDGQLHVAFSFDREGTPRPQKE